MKPRALLFSLRLFLLTVTVPISLSLSAQGFLKASNTQIVDGSGNNIILRGIGLGGWMLQEGYMLHVNNEGQQHKIRQRIDSLIGDRQTKEFYDTWLENFVTKADIDSLHAWGFNSIRLPMHYNLYTLPVEKEPKKGEQTWIGKGFAMTDSLLKWCKANNMYLILDLHAAPGGQGNDLNISDRDTSFPSLWASEANRAKTVALWTKLAEKYANEPWIGGYDILNEPNFGFQDASDRNGQKETANAPLKALLQEITSAIRSKDKNHIIIIEGNAWGNNYKGMLPTWDDNMVLSFHKYWNYNNTEAIQNILNTREQYKVPVWLGETGENSNVWYTQAIQLLEQNNIGWAWWPLKKIGVNNPLEIISNLNYDQIANYWAGKGRKPNESNSYSGLLELATYTRIENNKVHRDVLDAMFRQPYSDKEIPFKSNYIKNGSVVQAVDYDLGRNGSAYYDRDTADYWVSGGPKGGNSGRTYRNDGVDIRKDSSAFEKFYVTDIQDGEWLQYTIDVQEAGNYSVSLRTQAFNSSASLTLISDNKSIAANVKLPSTEKGASWLNAGKLTLTKGRHILRVRMDKGGFNFFELKFSK